MRFPIVGLNIVVLLEPNIEQILPSLQIINNYFNCFKFVNFFLSIQNLNTVLIASKTAFTYNNITCLSFFKVTIIGRCLDLKVVSQELLHILN